MPIGVAVLHRKQEEISLNQQLFLNISFDFFFIINTISLHKIRILQLNLQKINQLIDDLWPSSTLNVTNES